MAMVKELLHVASKLGKPEAQRRAPQPPISPRYCMWLQS